MSDPTKRELRQQKRELKRGLAENPDEAPSTETAFGRDRSAPLNGMDRDATRRRDDPAGADRSGAGS